MTLIEMIHKDLIFSIKDENELGLENYRRISSKLLPLYKYIICPLIICFILTSIIVNIERVFTEKIVLYEMIAFLPALFIYCRFFSLKNVFLSKNDENILIPRPFSRNVLIIGRNQLLDIKPPISRRSHIVSLKYRKKAKISKVRFMATFQKVHFGEEHEIVKELNDKLQHYKNFDSTHEKNKTSPFADFG